MYIGVTNYPDFLKTQSVQTTIAGQTSLTGLNYDPGNVEVYKNGLRLLPSQYAAPDGMNITLYAGAALNDKFDIVSREENAVGSDVVSVNGKTGVVVLDHYDLPDMPWLDGTGRIPSSLLPASVVGAVVYQGTWNASSGSAPSASPTKGQYWVVSVAGTTNLSGIVQWYIGDTAIYNGTAWDRLDGSANEVLSVNGRTGNVVITSADVETALSWRPVQEGGGFRQVAGHKVKIGWGNDGLTATVDTQDVGQIVLGDTLGRIHADGAASTLLLGSNKGLIEVKEDNAFYGSQYLRLRAEPSYNGSPYGELLIGSNGQNYITGNTNLSGGAISITPTLGDNSTKVATTAFVQTALGNFAGLADKVDRAGDTMTDSLRILGSGNGIGTSSALWAGTVISSPAGWAAPTNVQGSANSQFATISGTGIYNTAKLLCSGYGFAIPSGAFIDGISIHVISSVSNNATDCFGNVQLRYAGSPVGVSQWFAEGSGATINGTLSTWGTTLTPAMINDPSFGLELFYSSNDFEFVSADIKVDSIQIEVFYIEYGQNSGTLYLGDSFNKYLQFNGANYVLNNAPLTVGGAITASGGTINGPLTVGTPSASSHAATKSYVDNKTSLIHPMIIWTDVIDIATSTYTSGWATVKTFPVNTPTFTSSSKTALIMFQSGVHCYTDGTNGHGHSIEWRLLWNGNQIGYVQTNATATDDTVCPIIFMVPVTANSASSNTLTLQAYAHSTTGLAKTNHGQDPNQGPMGQSEINIMYF